MSRHIKRIPAPKSWPVLRKVRKFILKPMPGKHSADYALPIGVILRDMLKYVHNLKEAELVLRQKKVLVDGKPVREAKYNVGLFDVISLPEAKENYRILINSFGKLYLMKIDDKEAKEKIVRIESKRLAKGGKFQYGLSDGRNLLTDEKYNTYDSLLISLPDQKIIKLVPFTKGNLVYLISGNHVGTIGVLKEVKPEVRRTKVVISTDKGDIETLKKYVVMIGDKKPEIKVQ